MKVAYFDCFSGVSGDMTLGALVDAGLELAVLRDELAKLPVEHYRLEAELVKRSGLRGTKVHVRIDETQQPTRKYTDIVKMITESDLRPEVAQQALDIFRRLGEVEAHLHLEPLEAIHFHEVGAVDSIVDVVGAVIGMHALGVQAVLSSPINVGHGTVRTAHGLLPVPAPATLELVKGCPTYAGDVRMEMTTPTGAAIVTTLASGFGPLPHIQVEHVGYGAGNRDLPGQPNLLRVILGEVDDHVLGGSSHGHHHHHEHHHHDHGHYHDHDHHHH
ncbi:TIGR00299 family protein [Candidatus Entotheonella serta]|nr:TIGR00299 family protein [Candidatus Entotheonella serta]